VTCAFFAFATEAPAAPPGPSARKPPDCVVPDATLKRFSAAKRAVVKHGFRLGRVTRIYSFQVPRGVVIAQSPWSGRRLKHGARVSLVVSRGRPLRR
jgi:serine/threonine-protein kinase